MILAWASPFKIGIRQTCTGLGTSGILEKTQVQGLPRVPEAFG